jgi:RNA polymerase sigma-70 factor (ECF subfamily)
MKSNPEEKLIRAGDHGAFNRLFDQYSPRVLGYLIRLTGSRADAEDLTQETFLAAYAGRAGWRGEAQALAWLLGIARRRWRDRSRKAVIAAGSLLEETLLLPDPTSEVDTAAVLTEAMSRLSEMEREVLLLTAVEGLTYPEAAVVLGEPVGTVKWRVHQATRKLRRILNAAEERDEAQTLEPRNRTRPACATGSG